MANDTTAHDDETLVARCRLGDQRAWGELVRRYQRLVYAIALRGGLDEHAAADVFQTVFARLVQHLPRIAEPQRLNAWIVTTAKRETWLQRRVARRVASLAQNDDGDAEVNVADATPIAEEALQELQELNRVRTALDALDTRCRDLLSLLFAASGEAASYDEVAQRLGVRVGSIGPSRARCLEKLRRALQ